MEVKNGQIRRGVKSYNLPTLLVCLLITPSLFAGTVTVSAAISLKDALGQITKAYQKETGEVVRVNVGGSGQLMEQIENGAPVDVFVSASPWEVEELEKAKMVKPGSRRVIAHNRLVLVVPKGKEGIGSFEDLAKGGVKRIAVGKPKAVPAGDYAAEVFEHLKIADAVKGKLVYGANVRQVLDYVRRGEVDAGVVYSTDAAVAGEEVKVVAKAPEGSHRPVTYEGVVIKGAGHAGAGGKFLEYLGGKDARRVLEGAGFEVEGKGK